MVLTMRILVFRVYSLAMCWGICFSDVCCMDPVVQAAYHCSECSANLHLHHVYTTLIGPYKKGLILI